VEDREREREVWKDKQVDGRGKRGEDPKMFSFLSLP